MKKATRQQTKNHNTHLVLRTIYQKGEISRAGIARATGLTRPTVSNIVTELIEKRLVVEVGQGPSAGGKRPTLLCIAYDAYQLLCIDLANQEFRGAIVNLRGDIKHRLTLPIYDRDGDAALALVYRLIDSLKGLADNPVLGIGIGTPGLVNVRQGVIRNAINLDWHNLPLGDLLKERYQMPVYIANDSQIAALGEFTFGDNKDITNLIVIKIGRGVSSGIVINRQLYFGDGFGAGEIGHIVVVENGKLCRCGNYGCLETLISSRALVEKARLMAQNDFQATIRQIISTPEDITTDILLQAFDAGDEAIWALFNEAGLSLGRVIASLVEVLNINHIVIAGSMACFSQAMMEPIRQQINKGALAGIVDDVKVTVSDLDDDIVILGAAALILTNELGLV